MDRDGTFTSRRGPGEGVGCKLRKDRIQMPNGKWQYSNGLPIAILQITNHLPFALCHLPFELLFLSL